MLDLFHETCIALRTVDPCIRRWRHPSRPQIMADMGQVREAGRMFAVSEGGKDRRAPLQYWVLCRIEVVTSAGGCHSSGQADREVYVCCLDGCSAAAVEMAFKMAFGV